MATALLVLAVFCAGVVTLSLSGRGTAHPRRPPPSPASLASRDARAFLAHYVAPDGRVVRRDQGGDTVSEGQGYALLVSVAVDDRSLFGRVWQWEAHNLQLPDGLFAFHWAHGRVVTATPASDADLETAWALVLAGARFRDTAYTDDGLRVARSIFADESERVGGRLELVAGPWARKTPAVVDPSYLVPEAMDALASAGAGPSWRTLADDSTALVGSLEHSVASHLPSNWARLAPNGAVTPSGPDGKGRAAYGLDAQRVPVWFAADCGAAGRAVGAAPWRSLRSTKGTGGRIVYGLNARPRSRALNPVGFVAAAAAADAAGHRTDGRRLLARADRQNAVYRTYYGSAWLALGRILLDTPWLSSCPPG